MDPRKDWLRESDIDWNSLQSAVDQLNSISSSSTQTINRPSPFFASKVQNQSIIYGQQQQQQPSQSQYSHSVPNNNIGSSIFQNQGSSSVDPSNYQSNNITNNTDQIFHLLSSLKPIYPTDNSTTTTTTTTNGHPQTPARAIQENQDRDRDQKIDYSKDDLLEFNEEFIEGSDPLVEDKRKELKEKVEGDDEKVVKRLKVSNEDDQRIEEKKFGTDPNKDHKREELRTESKLDEGVEKREVRDGIERKDSSDRASEGLIEEEKVRGKESGEDEDEALRRRLNGFVKSLEIRGKDSLRSFKDQLNRLKERQDEFELRSLDERNRLRSELERNLNWGPPKKKTLDPRLGKNLKISSNQNEDQRLKLEKELIKFDRSILIKWDQLKLQQLNLLKNLGVPNFERDDKEEDEEDEERIGKEEEEEEKEECFEGKRYCPRSVVEVQMKTVGMIYDLINDFDDDDYY